MTPTLVRSESDRLVLHRILGMAFAMGSSLYEMSGHVNQRKQIQTSINKMQIVITGSGDRTGCARLNVFHLLSIKREWILRVHISSGIKVHIMGLIYESRAAFSRGARRGATDIFIFTNRCAGNTARIPHLL